MAKRKIRWDERLGAAECARRVLPGLAKSFFEEVRSFLSSKRAPAQFHRMRLAAKRLRYILELFEPCYGPGLKQRLDVLKSLQDSLGDLTDVVATRRLLAKTVDAEVEQFLDRRAAELAGEFREQWRETFDAEGRLEWWTHYLRESSRPPSEKK